jgi:signal transduction histidine kinase
MAAWFASAFVVGGSLLLAVGYRIIEGNVVTHEKVDRELNRRYPPKRAELPLPDLNLVDPNERALLRRESKQQAAQRAEVEADLRAAGRRRTLLGLAFAFVAMLVGSLWAGWILAGRALRPVRRITETARRVSDSNLGERIALDGPNDELKQLADVFDSMLARLDKAFASQRRFVTDASHELRTPLAIMRTEIDVALENPHLSAAELREAAEVVREATERGEQLIESLLTLARSEREPALTDLDLAAVAEQAVDDLAAEADGLALDIRLSLARARIRGDRVLLERLVANLVENAVRYNRRGGWIRVVTANSGGAARLEVGNTGPPVLPSELGSLFEPFTRLDASRSRATGGAGLGLSIVKAVAESHGGTISATALSAGGLHVVVELPAAASDGVYAACDVTASSS